MSFEAVADYLLHGGQGSSMSDILASVGPNPASVFAPVAEVTGHAFANILGDFVRPVGVSHHAGQHEGGMANVAAAVAQAAAHFTR